MTSASQPEQTVSSQEMGSKATITVEYLDGNVQMSLDCPGEVNGGKPTVVASLAMHGCEAIGEAIREHFKVKHELVSNKRSPGDSTH